MILSHFILCRRPWIPQRTLRKKPYLDSRLGPSKEFFVGGEILFRSRFNAVQIGVDINTLVFVNARTLAWPVRRAAFDDRLSMRWRPTQAIDARDLVPRGQVLTLIFN